MVFVACFVAEQAKQHLILWVWLIRVPLHTLTLEVLYPVGLPIGLVHFLELLRDGVSKDLQRPVILPEAAEGGWIIAQGMPGRLYPGTIASIID